MTEEQMWCWWLIDDQHYPRHRGYNVEMVERLKLYRAKQQEVYQKWLLQMKEGMMKKRVENKMCHEYCRKCIRVTLHYIVTEKLITCSICCTPRDKPERRES